MIRKSKHILILLPVLGLLFWVSSCKDPVELPEEGPTPYVLQTPSGWPATNISSQNPLTVEGVTLGKRLFFDPLLSGNKTQSCASCHNQAFAFTDHGIRFSLGSEGDVGTRNSMPLFNLNWSKGYFWDGRASTVEELISMPIEAHFEMNLSMDMAVERLKAHPDYPALFRDAFPSHGITESTLRFAIAQFIRSIISGNSKWDEYFRRNPRAPDQFMTPAQKAGYLAFITETKGDCFHCHSPISPLFVNTNEREFSNNGLEAAPDSGYMKRTGNPNDRGKFKTPSLRNVMLTAPYMHDGRFATLDEVLDHYDHGFKYSPTLDAMLVKHLDGDLKPIPRLTEQDKQNLIEFLKLLTDTTFLTNPAYQP